MKVTFQSIKLFNFVRLLATLVKNIGYIDQGITRNNSVIKVFTWLKKSKLYFYIAKFNIKILIEGLNIRSEETTFNSMTAHNSIVLRD